MDAPPEEGQAGVHQTSESCTCTTCLSTCLITLNSSFAAFHAVRGVAQNQQTAAGLPASPGFMQVSFLHVYHHVLMMWAWLYVCKVECGGDAWFGAFVNSLVHVVMYTYYFLSQLGIPCPWKKYLTMMQMGQFCLCILQSAYVLVVRNAPAGLALAQAFVMANMLVLFSQFYRQSYGTKGTNGSNGSKKDA